MFLDFWFCTSPWLDSLQLLKILTKFFVVLAIIGYL
uniref:Uncharacterized protein n=1 Tax=Setaria italica TaxID=4555 RepID=K4ANT7_SETIT